MSISIIYLENAGEIVFSCPHVISRVGGILIDNLNREHIPFRSDGTGIFVRVDQFSNTKEIALKALKGFREVDISYKPYDFTGAIMEFGYAQIVPDKQMKTVETFFSRIVNAKSAAEAHRILPQIENIKKSCKALLDEHYAAIRPSLQMF